MTGKLTQREWKNDSGQTQKAYGIRADSVGVSTLFTPAPTPKFKNGMASTPAAREVSEEAPF